jgi:hypothetical protein
MRQQVYEYQGSAGDGPQLKGNSRWLRLRLPALPTAMFRRHERVQGARGARALLAQQCCCVAPQESGPHLAACLTTRSPAFHGGIVTSTEYFTTARPGDRAGERAVAFAKRRQQF